MDGLSFLEESYQHNNGCSGEGYNEDPTKCFVLGKMYYFLNATPVDVINTCVESSTEDVLNGFGNSVNFNFLDEQLNLISLNVKNRELPIYLTIFADASVLIESVSNENVKKNISYYSILTSNVETVKLWLSNVFSKYDFSLINTGIRLNSINSTLYDTLIKHNPPYRYSILFKLNISHKLNFQPIGWQARKNILTFLIDNCKPNIYTISPVNYDINVVLMYDNFIFSLKKDTHLAASYTDNMFPVHSVELYPLNDWLIWDHSGHGYKNKNVKACQDPLIDLPIIVVDFQVDKDEIKSIQALISMNFDSKKNLKTLFIYYYNDEDVIFFERENSFETHFIKFHDETNMLKTFCFHMLKNFLHGIYSESTTHYFVSYGNVLKQMMIRLMELRLYETIGECLTLANNNIGGINSGVFKFPDDAIHCDIHHIVNILYEDCKKSKNQFIGSTKLQRVALEYDPTLKAYHGYNRFMDSICKCLSIATIWFGFHVDEYLFNLSRLLHVTQFRLLDENVSYMKLIFNMLHVENLKVGKYICKNCDDKVDLCDEFKSLTTLAMPCDKNIGGIVYAQPGVYSKCQYYDFQSCFPSIAVEYNVSYENVAILTKNQFIQLVLNSDLFKEIIFDRNYYNLYVYTGVEPKIPIGYELTTNDEIDKLMGDDRILIISTIPSVIPYILKKMIIARHQKDDDPHFGRQLKFVSNYLIGSLGCRYSNIKSGNFIGTINMFVRRNISAFSNYIKTEYKLQTIYIDVDGLIIQNPNEQKINLDTVFGSDSFIKIKLDKQFEKIIIVAKKSFVSISKENQIVVHGGNNASSRNFHLGSNKYVPPFINNVLVFICNFFLKFNEKVEFCKMFKLIYIYLFSLKQQDLFKFAVSSNKVNYVYVLYDTQTKDPNKNIFADKLFNESVFIVQNYYFYMSKYVHWIINLYNVVVAKKISSGKIIQEENKLCFSQVVAEVVNFNKLPTTSLKEYLLEKFSFEETDLKLFD